MTVSCHLPRNCTQLRVVQLAASSAKQTFFEYFQIAASSQVRSSTYGLATASNDQTDREIASQTVKGDKTEAHGNPARAITTTEIKIRVS